MTIDNKKRLTDLIALIEEYRNDIEKKSIEPVQSRAVKIVLEEYSGITWPLSRADRKEILAAIGDCESLAELRSTVLRDSFISAVNRLQSEARSSSDLVKARVLIRHYHDIQAHLTDDDRQRILDLAGDYLGLGELGSAVIAGQQTDSATGAGNDRHH